MQRKYDKKQEKLLTNYDKTLGNFYIWFRSV